MRRLLRLSWRGWSSAAHVGVGTAEWALLAALQLNRAALLTAPHSLGIRMLELKVYLNGRLLTTEYMTADVCTIGRLPESDISLQNPAVSRRHAELREVDGAYLLRDLGSSNGVKVNGQRVESVEVKAGDRIYAGTYEIVVGSTARGAHSDSMAATYAHRVALPRLRS